MKSHPWKNVFLACILCIPALVLVGWCTNTVVLTQILPQFTPMNPVTTVLFLMIGIMFVIMRWGSRRSKNIAFWIVAGFTTLVGIAMIVKYLGGPDIRIDRVLFVSRMGPNRMAPVTAINFLLFGISLYLSRTARLVTQILMTVMGLLSLYAVAAYVYNFVGVYGHTIYNPVALHTAVTFILCGIYFIFMQGVGQTFPFPLWNRFSTWFNNIPVKRKFWVGFGTVTILTLFLGTYSVLSIRKIENITRLQQNTVLASQAALMLNQDIDRSIQTVADYISAGTTNPSSDDVASARAAVTNQLLELRKYNSIPEVVTFLDQYEATRPARLALSDKIVEAIKKGDKPASYQSLVNKRNENIKDIRASLQHIVEIEQANLDKTLAASGNQVRVIEINLIFILALIIIFMLVASSLITNAIISSVQKLIEYATRINGGDYAVDLSLDTQDEIGTLSRALDSMSKSILHRTAELGIANAKNEAILSGIGDAVFALDRNGTIILFNPVAEQLSKVSREDAIGKKYDEVLKFVHEDTGIASYDFILSALKGKHATMKNHTLLIRPDGTSLSVADSAAPIWDEHAAITGAVIVFRDTTQERQVDRSKTEFVSLASHQLRTPLSSIRWYTELLLGGDGGKITKTQKEFLQQIEDSGGRMASLVNSLLNVSRIDMGTLASDPVQCNLVDMSDSVIAELLPSIEKKQLAITKDYSSSLPEFKADKNLMRILLQNLISNSVKYTPEKGTVTVSLSADKRKLHVRVADNGYGIPESAKAKIFSKLYRADNVRDKDTDGNGLGLYLVKSIVETHGGKVWYDSKENEGTTFYIDLPLSGMKKIGGTRTLTTE